MISPIAPIAATRRLLIVDDSGADRLLIGSSVRVASGDRYLVDEAENGVQALALLKDKAYAASSSTCECRASMALKCSPP